MSPKYIYIKKISDVEIALKLLSDNKIFAFVSSFSTNKQTIVVKDYDKATYLLAKNDIYFKKG